jgi:hypothetical protein
MNRGLIVITLAGLALLSTNVANAAEELYGGIKGGVNFANQNTDPEAELDARTGMAVGGYVGIPVTPIFAVQPEGFFTMKGSSFEGGSAKLNYIEVPVLARASFMNEASASEDIDVKDNTNPIDFGVVVGGGVEIPFSEGKNSVGLDLRYTMGLNNIDDSDSGADVKNGVFQIMGSVGLF